MRNKRAYQNVFFNVNFLVGMFAFDLYDRDASGVLEEKDVDLMMRDIYGKEANTSHYARQ